MDNARVISLEANFTKGLQWTKLLIWEDDDGSYQVAGKGVRECYERLHGNTTTICEGRLFQVDIEGLMKSIALLRDGVWWHHYRSDNRPWWYSTNEADGWSLKISYANGTEQRFEGSEDGPSNLDKLYDLLVLYGMPEIDKLPYYTSGDRGYQELYYLNQYLDMLGDAYEQDDAYEVSLLEHELIDDAALYVNRQEMDVSAEQVLGAWGVELSAKGLVEADVSHARRPQMLALFWALGHLEDPHLALLSLQERGVLQAWLKRMGQLPYEEAEEREQAMKKSRQQTIAAIEDNIRKHIESGDVFTSGDIAGDVGATKQQVSAYIRKYMKKGAVQRVGDTYPRRYQAAAA